MRTDQLVTYIMVSAYNRSAKHIMHESTDCPPIHPGHTRYTDIHQHTLNTHDH